MQPLDAMPMSREWEGKGRRKGTAGTRVVVVGSLGTAVVLLCYGVEPERGVREPGPAPRWDMPHRYRCDLSPQSR